MTGNVGFTDIDAARQHARNRRAYLKAARTAQRRLATMTPQQIADEFGVDLHSRDHTATSEGDPQ